MCCSSIQSELSHSMRTHFLIKLIKTQLSYISEHSLCLKIKIHFNWFPFQSKSMNWFSFEHCIAINEMVKFHLNYCQGSMVTHMWPWKWYLFLRVTAEMLWVNYFCLDRLPFALLLIRQGDQEIDWTADVADMWTTSWCEWCQHDARQQNDWIVS